MKAATVILLLALGALALAHRDGSDHHRYKKHDHDHYKKKDHSHNHYNHHSSSHSSPEHRYRHREHYKRHYKRDTAAVTALPADATTPLPVATTLAPQGRQADAIVSTTPVPVLPAATTLMPEGRQADAIVSTTPVPKPDETTLAAQGRQADVATTTAGMPTSAPEVIGTPIQTAQDCDFTCKFFTLVNAEDGTPVSFNYRTSPTCLQVDAFCEPGFTLVTYGTFAPVPLDGEDHGIINCFNNSWFDMNGGAGSNVMCMKSEDVSKSFTSTTPADAIAEAAPIEPEQTTTILPFEPTTLAEIAPTTAH